MRKIIRLWITHKPFKGFVDLKHILYPRKVKQIDIWYQYDHKNEMLFNRIFELMVATLIQRYDKRIIFDPIQETN